MILHPERLLGLRGGTYLRDFVNVFSMSSYEQIKHAYKTQGLTRLDSKLDHIDVESNLARLQGAIDKKRMVLIAGSCRDILNRVKSPNQNFLMVNAVDTVCEFREKKRVFRFSKDFFATLRNVEVPLNYSFLSKFQDRSGYVVFPETVNGLYDGFYFSLTEVKLEGNRHNSVAITVVPTFDYGLVEKRLTQELSQQKVSMSRAERELIIKTTTDADNFYEAVTTSSYSLFTDSMDRLTVKELDYINTEDGGKKAMTRVDFFSSCISCIVYINSLEPDLQKTVPDENFTSKRKRELAEKGIGVNEFTLPVINVSWNYKKPVMYNVDGCLVESHLRWQPCGPNRSQVKLILVKEHERHYKNVRKNGTTKTTTNPTSTIA